jgi:hypothetical protein
MSIASERYVWLRGNLVVPIDPMLLLLDLEAKGFKLTRDGDDILVCPASRLTEDDRRLLKTWRSHVLVLLDYVANPPEVH